MTRWDSARVEAARLKTVECRGEGSREAGPRQAGGDTPKFRNLWDYIGKRVTRKGRGTSGKLDPLSLPAELQTALDALYGHYQKGPNGAAFAYEAIVQLIGSTPAQILAWRQGAK
jgi:hypothetical protein